MTNNEIFNLFSPLYDSIENLAIFQENRPSQVVHYTSLDVLEKIMQSEEVWFSNPLFMNDKQEMTFGMSEGLKEYEKFVESDCLKNACETEQRYNNFKVCFDYYLQQFNNKALDVYVFCLSEHNVNDNDGKLSMWRGYGENGSGAAIVFNTHLLKFNQNSPLLFAKVQYNTDEYRIANKKQRLMQVMEIIKNNLIPDEMLYIAAHQMFDQMVIFSLIEKHLSFSEEKEWRVIYFPDRDVEGIFKDRFSYIVTKNGIEPKLKFKIQPMPNMDSTPWTFCDLINRIIIGLCISSWVAEQAIRRMLAINNKASLSLVSSCIPYRPSK